MAKDPEAQTPEGEGEALTEMERADAQAEALNEVMPEGTNVELPSEAVARLAGEEQPAPEPQD